uniref:Uncharacterized protein n=1 Tax=Molossus molossus TaxID=27622 RepID=A0A7J8EEN9_MOLMO|nr:hypothetical protein HJG59_008845 [Molossus molossus]
MQRMGAACRTCCRRGTEGRSPANAPRGEHAAPGICQRWKVPLFSRWPRWEADSNPPRLAARSCSEGPSLSRVGGSHSSGRSIRGPSAGTGHPTPCLLCSDPFVSSARRVVVGSGCSRSGSGQIHQSGLFHDSFGYTGVGKSRFTVVSTRNTVYWCMIIYYIYCYHHY